MRGSHSYEALGIGASGVQELLSLSYMWEHTSVDFGVCVCV